MPPATECGSVSHGHMNSERWVAARVSSPSMAASSAPPGGRGGAEARQRGEPPEIAGLAEGLDAGRRQRPAANLDDEVVEALAARQRGADHLPAERLTALAGQPVAVALAGERDG